MSKLDKFLRPHSAEPGGSAAQVTLVEGEMSEWIGREIRSLRKARSVTLQQLADHAGLSVGYLSQIERNISTPSIQALYRISRALGVNISWFFGPGVDAPPEEREYIVRAARRRQLRFSTGEAGITDSLLSPNLDGQLELLLSRFSPGSSSGEQSYTHTGEEAGIVITGRLELWIGDQYFLLEEGDSFTFPSTTPHRYRNPAETETVVIWAITPPTY